MLLVVFFGGASFSFDQNERQNCKPTVCSEIGRTTTLQRNEKAYPDFLLLGVLSLSPTVLNDARSVVSWDAIRDWTRVLNLIFIVASYFHQRNAKVSFKTPRYCNGNIFRPKPVD